MVFLIKIKKNIAITNNYAIINVMKIIVGLGNPDGKYKNTYHNVGFSVVDFFAKSKGLKFNKTKCKAELAVADDFVLAKPQTYMNLSGMRRWRCECQPCMGYSHPFRGDNRWNAGCP